MLLQMHNRPKNIIIELNFSSLFAVVTLIIDYFLMTLYNLSLPLATFILLNNVLEGGV